MPSSAREQAIEALRDIERCLANGEGLPDGCPNTYAERVGLALASARAALRAEAETGEVPPEGYPLPWARSSQRANEILASGGRPVAALLTDADDLAPLARFILSAVNAPGVTQPLSESLALQVAVEAYWTGRSDGATGWRLGPKAVESKLLESVRKRLAAIRDVGVEAPSEQGCSHVWRRADPDEEGFYSLCIYCNEGCFPADGDGPGGDINNCDPWKAAAACRARIRELESELDSYAARIVDLEDASEPEVGGEAPPEPAHGLSEGDARLCEMVAASMAKTPEDPESWRAWIVGLNDLAARLRSIAAQRAKGDS